MLARSLLGLSMGAVLVLGCDRPPVAPPPDVPVVKIAPPHGTVAPVEVPPPAALATVPMYAVARIYSLLDVQATQGGLELRMGDDPGFGSGMIRSFVYVPLVKGVPDFEQETSSLGIASTAGGFEELVGRRPNLMMHTVAGFRSSATDTYQTLGEDNDWGVVKLPELQGTGEGIFPWTKDRLLEWRGPWLHDVVQASTETRLPKLRVVQGADKAAPTLPADLVKRLTSEGFSLATFTVLPAGEVLAIGYLTKSDGFGTVLWTDDVKQPAYFVSSAEGLTETSQLHILGGTTLKDLRLQVLNRILRLEGSSWVVESTTAPGTFPDLWFGTTIVLPNSAELVQGEPEHILSLCPAHCEAFARTAKGGPWLPVEYVDTTGDPQEDSSEGPIAYVVDKEGTIWGAQGTLLVSSKKPAERFDVTEEALVLLRKRSILRGGSMDATGAPPDHFAPPKDCRMHYVLLDRSPAAKAPADFPKIRAALKGHTELSGVKLVFSREKDWQFFGAQIADEDLAKKLATIVRKSVKSTAVYCAEPVPTGEIKIDLKTGDRLP